MTIEELRDEIIKTQKVIQTALETLEANSGMLVDKCDVHTYSTANALGQLYSTTHVCDIVMRHKGG